MKTAVEKRSIRINGEKTSVSLESEFYSGLMAIAAHEKMSLSELIEQIDASRNTCNLSSAIRIFVLRYYRAHISKGKVIKLDPPKREMRRRALRGLVR